MQEASWGESRAGLAGAEDTGCNSSVPDGGKEESLAQESRGPNLSDTGGSLLVLAHLRKERREKKRKKKRKRKEKGN
ncbi:hypothetical protein TIFTF001_010078 [Ficus carica]|uniref:Uncharacterized protein n=1 Tax=Ficus carica TaxID=3494 RepID=A0AA88D1T5_FICCA|nr:hypothetical protein TIFTF001_010078 [Ficus carica]